MTLVKEVVNEVVAPREVRITCPSCRASFDYNDDGIHYHERTSCPWCKQAVPVPRSRLRDTARGEI